MFFLYKDFIFKNVFVKQSFTMFFWRGFRKPVEKFLKADAFIIAPGGAYTYSGTRGLIQSPLLVPAWHPLQTFPEHPNDLAGARPNNTQKGFQLNFQKLTDVQTLKIFNASSLFAYCFINHQRIGKVYSFIRLQQAGSLD